jgi:hypothetical protein
MTSMTTAQLAVHLEQRTAGWPAEQRTSVLRALASAKARRDLVASIDHPAALAASCDPEYRITPAIEIVSRSIERVLREKARNLLVTAPPQELKSTLCAIWTPLRALQLHPDWAVMLVTYADGLAEEHSFTARRLVENYGTGALDSFTGSALPDKLGLSLMKERNSVGRWRINEGKGGLVAAGMGATITGRRADLIIIDDPYKNQQEADSDAHRKRVLDTYQSVIRTRLSPGGSMILIQTRWHPSDLAGHLLKEQADLPRSQRNWRYVNIPAVSHAGVPDALKRTEPGIAMESARGRTAEEFAEIRRAVGERVWFAMYEGIPAPPEGGLFTRSWFETTELAETPANAVITVVAIDPAETGENDEAGIIAASMLRNGTVALIRDASGAMTSDQWATRAVELSVEVGASEIWVESYTAGLTYLTVVKRAVQAMLRSLVSADVSTAALAMDVYQRRNVLSSIRVKQWRGTGDAVARSGLLRQAVEVGTCRAVVPELDTMIDQAVTWQAGQHQPDRVAAGVIAHDVLAAIISRTADLANPNRSSDGEQRRNPYLARRIG